MKPLSGKTGSDMPDRLGVRDLERSMTWSQWNRRACRLANALTGLGLAAG